jgi:hypothetical protein
MADEELICPSCGRSHPPSERVCEACGMPLKIKPEYTHGKLVKVARAANQPEAELIEGLLLEEGIPSMLRRSAGFDVAESLAAGPRDVLVPESGAQAAREALAWEGRPGA